MINRSINLLFPPFYRLVQTGLDACQVATGKKFAIFEGYRSAERQDELYRQGRTMKGPVVTHAKGGQSWHQYGLAVDIAILEKNGGWSWDFNPRMIAQYMSITQLKWGGTQDGCHYEMYALPNLAIAEVTPILQTWAWIEARIRSD